MGGPRPLYISQKPQVPTVHLQPPTSQFHPIQLQEWEWILSLSTRIVIQTAIQKRELKFVGTIMDHWKLAMMD
ncbi:MAG: hypothetical protein CL981_03265 [Euryarchaeota archaeon]|nr:hypothetical protein [Euryarchaeota archaeon]